MIRTILLFIVCFACSLKAQTSLSPEQQAGIDVEMKMEDAWDKLGEARHALDYTISKVKDPTRQKLLRDALAANEETFEKLLDSEAILRYGGAIVGHDGRPDVRVRRVVSAEHAAERCRQFNKWNDAIIRTTAP